MSLPLIDLLASLSQITRDTVESVVIDMVRQGKLVLGQSQEQLEAESERIKFVANELIERKFNDAVLNLASERAEQRKRRGRPRRNGVSGTEVSKGQAGNISSSGQMPSNSEPVWTAERQARAEADQRQALAHSLK